MPDIEFLKRRNALWQKLRTQVHGTPAFEDVLTELSTLIGWKRARILAGLGQTSDPTHPDRSPERKPT